MQESADPTVLLDLVIQAGYCCTMRRDYVVMNEWLGRAGSAMRGTEAKNIYRAMMSPSEFSLLLALGRANLSFSPI